MINLAKECLWYNGEVGVYELLDFNPDGLTKAQIIRKAKEILNKEYAFDDVGMRKAMETLYLIDIDNLEHVVTRR